MKAQFKKLEGLMSESNRYWFGQYAQLVCTVLVAVAIGLWIQTTYSGRSNQKHFSELYQLNIKQQQVGTWTPVSQLR